MVCLQEEQFGKDADKHVISQPRILSNARQYLIRKVWSHRSFPCSSEVENRDHLRNWFRQILPRVYSRLFRYRVETETFRARLPSACENVTIAEMLDAFFALAEGCTGTCEDFRLRSGTTFRPRRARCWARNLRLPVECSFRQTVEFLCRPKKILN